MKMNTITNKTALINCIIDNESFKGRRVNASQIGAVDFRLWKDLMGSVHTPAYNVYKAQEDHEPKEVIEKFKDATVDAVKEVFKELGDLYLLDADGKPHATPIKVDADFVAVIEELCSKYAGRVGTQKAVELQIVESQISNNNKLLKQYEELNGVKEETIEKIKKELEELDKEKARILELPDMRKGRPEMTSLDTFRLQLENHIGRFLKGEKAKSWEEKQAEDEKKKAERKARKKNK